MTYQAQRYTRYGDGPHGCPDAHVSSGKFSHNLIPDPERRSAWVCPFALDQERGEAHRAEQARLIEEERHERARVIAEVVSFGISTIGHDELVKLVTRAVLAGMAEERGQ